MCLAGGRRARAFQIAPAFARAACRSRCAVPYQPLGTGGRRLGEARPSFRHAGCENSRQQDHLERFWPVDTVLNNAARYRKLQQLAKRVYIDGIATIQFPRIAATGGDEGSFENSVNLAVDDLPDRNRW